MRFLLAALFLDALAGSLIGPILPNLLRGFTHEGEAAVAQLMGAFLLAFALVQFVSSPAQGALSDHFGRRPILLASMFGLAVDYLIMAVAPSVGWLFVGRVIAGVMAGSIAPAYAYVVDVAPDARRGVYLGRLAAAMGAGAVLGPVVGGFLGELHLRAPFYLAAACSLAAGLYGLARLPESLPPERRARLDWRRMHPLGAATGLLRDHPILRRWALTQAAVLVAAYGAGGILAIYASFRFGWTPGRLGLVFMSLAVINIAVQAGAVGPVMARLGEARTVVLGLVLQGSGLMIAGLAGQGWQFWAAFGLVTAGGITGPALSSLVTRTVKSDQQGAVLGAARSLSSGAAIVAPPLFAGLLAASVHTLPGTPFVVGAVLTFAGVGLALWAARYGRISVDPAS